MWKEEIEKARAGEPFIQFELFRLLRNAISHGLEYPGSHCRFVEVLPEFPVSKGREGKADIVVFAEKSGRIKPYLVIETKRRVSRKIGPSASSALRRAKFHAEKLGILPGGFFGTYNGWTLMIFKNTPPYLVTAAGKITSEDDARNLLLGLEHYAYTGKLDLLKTLPKVEDPDLLVELVFPSLAKEFAREEEKIEELLEKWKEVLRD